MQTLRYNVVPPWVGRSMRYTRQARSRSMINFLTSRGWSIWPLMYGHHACIGTTFPSQCTELTKIGVWEMCNCMLSGSSCCITPHNRETTPVMFFELLSNWSLFGSIKGITTDNASNMSSAMKKLIKMLDNCNNTSCTVAEIPVRCITHVVNLAGKDCLGDVYKHVDQIRCLLSAKRCSTKRRDICKTT